MKTIFTLVSKVSFMIMWSFFKTHKVLIMHLALGNRKEVKINLFKINLLR
jgi:hypothetical protein